ncbi:hypothetical protein B0H14DRAFT_3732677 [Mycena olivaceomarginata]|nr:hypothetical protein B0H14DRAFT_3732677 [Mycena olivaceomarginata]
MTRGNQRDQDRLKAQKKAAAGKSKPKESATTLQKRKEADAEALRAKQKACAKKEEEKAATTTTTSGQRNQEEHEQGIPGAGACDATRTHTGTGGLVDQREISALEDTTHGSKVAAMHGAARFRTNARRAMMCRSPHAAGAGLRAQLADVGNPKSSAAPALCGCARHVLEAMSVTHAVSVPYFGQHIPFD